MCKNNCKYNDERLIVLSDIYCISKLKDIIKDEEEYYAMQEKMVYSKVAKDYHLLSPMIISRMLQDLPFKLRYIFNIHSLVFYHTGFDILKLNLISTICECAISIDLNFEGAKRNEEFFNLKVKDLRIHIERIAKEISEAHTCHRSPYINKN